MGGIKVSTAAVGNWARYRRDREVRDAQTTRKTVEAAVTTAEVTSISLT